MSNCFLALNGQDTPPFPVFEYRGSAEIIHDLSIAQLPQARAAAHLTFIGEYLKAQEISNEVDLAWGFDTLTFTDREYFNSFEAKDAVSTIIETAAQHQIVIINEAHHKPQHRLFTRQLLQGLYEKGYRHFGLEALTSLGDTIEKKLSGSTLNERGYPLNSPLSGTYTSEPQMANLIREALAVGFTVFDYEHYGKDREQGQAGNIAKIFAEDASAKILIHCGWYHLLEIENNGKKWMAHYLKEYTGIDPLTIYQDLLTERFSTRESPFYEMMDYHSTKVFVNESGHFYNGFTNNSFFDILVYHPRTRFIYNRPDWLYNYPGIQAFDVKNIDIAYPCLIKAYYSDEDHTAMPIDIIEKDHKNDSTVLCLPSGSYQLIIENQGGEKEKRTIQIE